MNDIVKHRNSICSKCTTEKMANMDMRKLSTQTFLAILLAKYHHFSIFIQHPQNTLYIYNTMLNVKPTRHSNHWRTSPQHIHSCCMTITNGCVQTNVCKLATPDMLLLRNMKNHNFRHILPRISRSTLTYITSVINFNFVILMRSCHQAPINKRKCDVMKITLPYINQARLYYPMTD